MSIVERPADKVFERELSEYLSRHLPSYLVPSLIIELSKLPLTVSGKVDTNALPPPIGSSGRSDLTRPEGPVEQELEQIFRHVLGVDSVGVDDNFFLLGGTSLGAVRVVALVRERLDESLTALRFYRGPTIRRIARGIEAGRRDGEGAR